MAMAHGGVIILAPITQSCIWEIHTTFSSLDHNTMAAHMPRHGGTSRHSAPKHAPRLAHAHSPPALVPRHTTPAQNHAVVAMDLA